MPVLSKTEENVHLPSPPGVTNGIVDSELYEQFIQAMDEARNLKQEAFDESLRRGKTKKEAVEAIYRAKIAEINYAKELKQRKDNELVIYELRQKSTMEAAQLAEAQLAESNKMIETLEEKVSSAVKLLKCYREEIEALQLERDNAVKLLEELKQKQSENSSTAVPTQFTVSEIEEATKKFHPSLKIGAGGYGIIYKGLLHHTEVAIKVMHPHSLQGPLEYQQEVDVLSKLRHPNLVTLIGTCPEIYSLIYEFLPNGSLEDRLKCEDNTPPLPWHYRIRIIAELCSVLVFLHSSKPHGIIHGDLKPSNILLDSNFVSKLSDFGISRIMPDRKTVSSNNSTVGYQTGLKGTFAYIDP